MRTSVSNPSPGLLAICLLLVMGAVLIAIGPPSARKTPSTGASNPLPEPSQIDGPGAKLVSVSVDFPEDSVAFPDGPHADTINANCTACHSASMALSQPRLNGDQWKAIVEKMRDTYKAPVPAAAVPDIVDYLTKMSDKLPTSAIQMGSPDKTGGTG